MPKASENATHGYVSRTTVGNATILAPSGPVTFENCLELRTALEQAAEVPRPVIVIDARQVGTFDSEALELLVDWHQKLQECGGALKLADLNDVCTDILLVTRLGLTLTVFADVAQAVQGGRPR